VDRWVVTSANQAFLPGAKALYHSVKKWCPDVGFGLLYYTDRPVDSDGVRDVIGQDAVVYVNVPIPESEDFGKKYSSNGMVIGPEMYARMLIPGHFPGRALYCDADCLVVGDISPLWTMDMKGYPSACVDRGDIGWSNDKTAMASGSILIDCDEWIRRDLPGKCLEYHAKDKPQDNVEGLISRVHGNDFLRLDPIYQNLAYYGSLCLADKILHYAGHKPWITSTDRWWCNYRALWDAYYANEGIDRLSAAIPEQRPYVDMVKNKSNRTTVLC